MKVYYQWNLAGLNTFHVCGANQQDRLFAVKVHTGLSMGGPLRSAQGVYLYNGPTTNDPAPRCGRQRFGISSRHSGEQQ